MIRFKYHLFFVSKCIFKNFVQKDFLCRRNISVSRFQYFLITSKLNANELVKRKTPSDQPVEEKKVVSKEVFFKQMSVKDKTAFLKIINHYKDTRGARGHLEFIFAALRCMDEFNVQADIETYKELMNVFPKGKYIPENYIQAEFGFHARAQDCAIEVLDKMEYNRVPPDLEMKELVINIFGKSSQVYKKYARMMYWMPKFKNINPYLPLEPLTSDTEELARIALRKMSVDPQTKLTHFYAKDRPDAIDETWIVSAQSPLQQKLLKDYPIEKPLFVEGTYLVWLRKISLSYFVLRGEPRPAPVVDIDDDDVSNLSLFMFGEPKPYHLTIRPNTIHEQEDGTVFGMCITGTSSKDSVLSWIHFLRNTNPILDKIPVLFKLRSAPTAVTTVNAPFSDDDEHKQTLDSEKHEISKNEDNSS